MITLVRQLMARYCRSGILVDSNILRAGPSAPAKAHFSVIIFGITIFMSSTLLFLLEPMFARMVLPVLGGTPAVWNSCMVFYQATLLAGYAYANTLTRRLAAPSMSALTQFGLLLIPLTVLPIRLPVGWSPPVDRNPIPWLFLILAVAAGLPFFALATLTPVLQKWFANTNHPSAGDPYFLYSASNAGSMVGLLAYPILIEPNLGIKEQSLVWTCGYGLLIILMSACAVILYRSSSAVLHRESRPEVPSRFSVSQTSPDPTFKQKLRWIALAFAPASLMLGVTTVLTTEIPPLPLFWVAPLAVYLLTFILVFARKPPVPHAQMVDRLPFVVLAALIPVFSKTALPVFLEIVLNLTALFVAAMVCHGELVKSRPSAKHLTEFYLWMSLGGVLGGMFNALVAPLAFHTVQEFPLALILAALLRPSAAPKTRRRRWLDLFLPLVPGIWVVGLLVAVQKSGLKPGPLMNLLIFAPAMLLCLSFAKFSLRFTLGVATLLIASLFYSGPYGHILHSERSFFGIYRVTEDDDGRFRLLFHGSTVHGMQSLNPLNRLQPFAYYTRSGPIGQVFDWFHGTENLQQVAIVGLGAGSMACYAERDQRFTFYEIDPAIERIARDAQYFTLLRDCAPNLSVTLGDARLSLNKVPNRSYGLIVIDAFGSDAIPVHLLTREAINLYLAKLTDNGVLVFHITNRYLDLQPVLATVAKDAGLICLAEDDTNISDIEMRNGKFPSRWLIMARMKDDLGNLARDPRWVPAVPRPGMRVWKDDFSSVLRAVAWN